MSASVQPPSLLLRDPRLFRDLAHTVRRRVDRSDADDVVQAALEEALTAKALPVAAEEVRRFVFAIARQKVADHYRRKDRERRCIAVLSSAPEPLAPASPEPPSAGLTRWVERTLPSSAANRETLDWMVREADGETLAEIAEADGVPPTMVRQRVSRLRRWLKARWTKEVVALALLALVAVSLPAVQRTRGTRRAIERELLAPPEAVIPEAAPAMVDHGPPILPQRIKPRPPPPPPRPARTAPPTAPSASQGSGPRAHVTRYVRSTTNAGAVERETTFEVSLPKIDISRCATKGTPAGVSHLSLRFTADGSIEQSRIDGGVLAGRREADCVVRLYSSVTLAHPPGVVVDAGTYVALVPEPLPAWVIQ